MKKAVLVITDGIGFNDSCEFNAFCKARKPTYEYLFKNAAHSLIKTSGLAVGLPEGQMGNSEVGHMCIGSGRILYQNLVKISKAIEDDTLKDNEVLKDLLKKSDTLHLIGLISDGGVHSHISHTIALAKIAKDRGKKVHIHMITDGRDVDPRSGIDYLKKIEDICDEDIRLSTISGRYYTMDRDNRWDRVKRGYDAIVKAVPKTSLSPKEYLESSYKKGVTDEFIEPVAFKDYNGFKEGDSVLFTNFRNDRMREISKAIGFEEFNEFDRGGYVKVHVATMTEYDKNYPFPVLFKSEKPKNTLGEVISNAGLDQFHTAETEKYAHVTFFFNGGVEEPLQNETRVLIPSPKVATYDLQPQMSAKKVAEAVLTAMDEEYEFVVVNFANGDMVGHTGVFEAGVKAVETVDRQLGKIIEKAKEKDYSFVLVSDHGNVEMMRDKEGNVLTNHTTFDVFCFVLDDRVKKIENGGLSNIAPTILKLMGLSIPKEMDKALF
ncbi:MAG: 2,3-bisphosphoglycerate-independent phosphoglycerate mutase [Epsilonproteobacteria bacterium]|nr:2,3-bisphosphoglycerate-independent phosphoglycerate mutase [Campylobacterota bacterium]